MSKALTLEEISVHLLDLNEVNFDGIMRKILRADVQLTHQEQKSMIQNYVQSLVNILPIRPSQYLLFADAVSGILSFAQEPVETDLLSRVLELMKIEEDDERLFGYYWRRVKKQCSVIVGLISTYSFDAVNDALADFFQNVDAKNAKNVMLFRFVRFPKDYLVDQVALVTDTVREMRHVLQVVKPMVSYLRFLLMQDEGGAAVSMANSVLKFVPKSAACQSVATEVDALILARQKDLTEKSIVEFFRSVTIEEVKGKKVKKKLIESKILMRCMMYLLNGNKFNEHFYWRHGSICGRVFGDKECISCPTADVGVLYGVMKDNLGEGDIDFWITWIVRNLLYRNHIQTIGLMMKDLNASDNAFTYPILDALWILCSQKEVEIDGHCKTSIVTSLIRLCERYRVKEVMTMATCPQFASYNSRPERIDPLLIPTPDTFLDNLMSSIEDDEASMLAKMPDSMKWSVLSLQYTYTLNHDRRYTEKIVAMLIALLSILPVTDDFVQCLIEFGLCGRTSIAQFSLLACQLVYMDNPRDQERIWKELFRVIKGPLSDVELLTILILAYHLMSLGVSVTDFWCENMQVVILLHLTSPYVCIRRVLLLIISKMEEIVRDRDTVFKPYKASQQRILHRIHQVLPSYPQMTFEDACKYHSLQLYACAFVEFLESISHARYSKVFAYFQALDRTTIKVPKAIEDAQRQLLMSCLLYRLAGIKESGYQLFRKDGQFLLGQSYIEFYRITDVMTVSDFKDESAAHFLEDLMKKFFEYSNYFINFIAKYLSPYYLAELISYMATTLKAHPGDGTQYVETTKLSETVKEITLNKDLQLCFYCYPRSFSDINFIILGFSVEIKKSGAAIPSEAYKLITNLCVIVRQVSKAIPYLFAAGTEGSLHQYRRPLFIDKEWAVSEKYRMMALLTKVGQGTEVAVSTLSALLNAGPVFRNEHDINFKEPYVYENLAVILQYHPFMLDKYITKSYKGDVRFFNAICALYYGTPCDSWELTRGDMNVNSEALAKRDVLLTLLFIYSFIEQETAFRTLRRLAAVFSALLTPTDLKGIARLNALFDTSPEPAEVIHAVLETIGPRLVTEVFTEGLSRLKERMSHEIEIRLFDVLSMVSKYIDLSSHSAGFISHVIDAYFLVPRHLQPRYISLFGAFCEGSQNSKEYLAQSLCQLSAKEKRKEAVVQVMSLLCGKYPETFVQRVIQSLSFGFWFFTNTYCSEFIHSDKEYIIYDDRDSCVEIVFELLKTNKHILRDHVATITHFCLLFCDDFGATFSVLREMLGVSDIYDHQHVVKKYKEQFKSIKDLQDWANIALKWFTSCGSLDIASRSGEILKEIHQFSGDMIQKIAWSLNSVLQVKFKRKYKSVARYVSSALDLIATIVSDLGSLNQKIETNLFNYLRLLRYRIDVDMQGGIIGVYSALINEEHQIKRTEYFDEIVPYAISFLLFNNENSLVSGIKFLIELMTQSTDIWQRDVLLFVLYPVLQECVTVHMSEAVNDLVNKCVGILKKEDFGGSISEIFGAREALFSRETMEAFASEMSLNHTYELEKSAKYLGILCFNRVPSVFRLLELIFDQSEKDWFYDTFSQVIWCAVHYRELHFLEHIEFSGSMRLSEPARRESISAVPSAKSFTAPKVYPQGEVDVNLGINYIPMIPLIQDSWKDCQVSVMAIREMTPQPFVKQDTALKTIGGTKRVSMARKEVEQNLDILLGGYLVQFMNDDDVAYIKEEVDRTYPFSRIGSVTIKVSRYSDDTIKLGAALYLIDRALEVL